MRNAIGFFFGADSMQTNKTKVSRGLISLGKPRKDPYLTNKELEDKWLMPILEPTLWSYFNMTTGFLKSAYRDPATTADLSVRYNQAVFFSKEFGTIVNNDFLMVAAALMFVWFYICVHTGSFPLGCLAILQIILSLPMALFFYAPFIPYFSNLHLLALFLCLGVGADDVFVFMDAWRQSALQPSLRTLSARMAYTYERTFYTVLNLLHHRHRLLRLRDRFHHAHRLLWHLCSPRDPAQLVLTVTWWPCAVLMWELYFAARAVSAAASCPSCCESRFIRDQTVP